jgi:hypothetical protein
MIYYLRFVCSNQLSVFSQTYKKILTLSIYSFPDLRVSNRITLILPKRKNPETLNHPGSRVYSVHVAFFNHYPAQQESFDTSRLKVSAANLRPSAIVR